MSKKLILLILLGLFLFNINLDTEKKSKIVKQNDKETTYVKNINNSIVLTNISIENNSLVFFTEYNSTVTFTSDILYNHFVNYIELTNKISRFIENINKVYITNIAKTIGLLKITYFNIYLYHSINKLGFT